MRERVMAVGHLLPGMEALARGCCHPDGRQRRREAVEFGCGCAIRCSQHRHWSCSGKTQMLLNAPATNLSNTKLCTNAIILRQWQILLAAVALLHEVNWSISSPLFEPRNKQTEYVLRFNYFKNIYEEKWNILGHFVANLFRYMRTPKIIERKRIV